MPLQASYKEGPQSPVPDLKEHGPGGRRPPSRRSVFLQGIRIEARDRLAHLDIAARSGVTRRGGWIQPGANGVSACAPCRVGSQGNA